MTDRLALHFWQAAHVDVLAVAPSEAELADFLAEQLRAALFALEPLARDHARVKAFVESRAAAANDAGTTMPATGSFRLRHFEAAHALWSKFLLFEATEAAGKAK